MNNKKGKKNSLAPFLDNTSLEHRTKSLIYPYNIKSLVVFIYSLFELSFY